MRALITRTKTFIEQHERILSAGALLSGFIVDSLTLRRIDLLAENIAITSYLLVAMFCIVVLALRERTKEHGRVLSWVLTVAPLVLQIAFGALFSAFVIFYSRSASLSASWPFMLFLLFMLIGNEAFRPRYEKLVFHVGVWFVALLSYSIMLVPTVLGSIGTPQFLLSIALSLALVALFLQLLQRIAPREVHNARGALIRTIGGIAALCFGAYITGLMPPAPLALSDSVIAHSVTKIEDDYTLAVEHRSFRDVVSFSRTFHRAQNEPVYVWTSVFAPTKLSTSIVHVWQRQEGSRWVDAGRIAFPITGGRGGGYRGYSVKNAIAPGAWRVSVETSNGLVIGRVRFNVAASDRVPELFAVER